MERLPRQLQEELAAAMPAAPGEIVDFAIGLLESLAASLVPLIGKDAFRSLLARSLHLASQDFPWLALDLQEWDHSDRFAALDANLRSRNHVQASAGALALFDVLVRTLVDLIGVALVSDLLHSAWGDRVVPR